MGDDIKWPDEFDSILVAPRYYQQFKTLPKRAAPHVANKIAGVDVVTDPYMPETGAAIMLRGEIVGWIEFQKDEP